MGEARSLEWLEWISPPEAVPCTPTDLMEIFDEEAFDEGLVFFKTVEHGLQFLRFERRTGQLRQLSKGDDREFFTRLRMYSLRNSARSTPSGQTRFGTASEILNDVARTNQRLHEFSEF